MNRLLIATLFIVSTIAPNYLNEQTAIAQNTNQAQLKTANVNEVKSFIYSWFALLDRQVSEISPIEFLDLDNLTMEVPEATIGDRDDFSNWYLEQQAIATNTYDIEQLEVIPQGKGKFDVRLKLNWQAKTPNGETLDRAYQQQWTIVTDERRRLLIRKYIVEEL